MCVGFAGAGHKINKFIYLHSQRRPTHTHTQNAKGQSPKRGDATMRKIEGGEWRGAKGIGMKMGMRKRMAIRMCALDGTHTHIHTHWEHRTLSRIGNNKHTSHFDNCASGFYGQHADRVQFCLSHSPAIALLPVSCLCACPCDWVTFLRAPTASLWAKLSSHLGINRSKYARPENRRMKLV